MSENNITSASRARSLPISPMEYLDIGIVEDKIIDAAVSGFTYIRICCESYKDVSNIATILSSSFLGYHVEVKRNKYGITFILVDWSKEKQPSYNPHDNHPYR